MRRNRGGKLAVLALALGLALLILISAEVSDSPANSSDAKPTDEVNSSQYRDNETSILEPAVSNVSGASADLNLMDSITVNAAVDDTGQNPTPTGENNAAVDDTGQNPTPIGENNTTPPQKNKAQDRLLLICNDTYVVGRPIEISLAASNISLEGGEPGITITDSVGRRTVFSEEDFVEDDGIYTLTYTPDSELVLGNYSVYAYLWTRAKVYDVTGSFRLDMPNQTLSVSIETDKKSYLVAEPMNATISTKFSGMPISLPVNVYVLPPYGGPVLVGELVTDSSGKASMSYAYDSIIILGKYKLIAFTHDETGREVKAETGFEINAEKKGSHAKISMDKESYWLGDELEVYVEAEQDGSPIEGAIGVVEIIAPTGRRESCIMHYASNRYVAGCRRRFVTGTHISKAYIKKGDLLLVRNTTFEVFPANFTPANLSTPDGNLTAANASLLQDNLTAESDFFEPSKPATNTSSMVMIRDCKGQATPAVVNIIRPGPVKKGTMASRLRGEAGAEIEPRLQDVEVLPSALPVKRIMFKDLNLEQTPELGLEELQEPEFVQSYAIDPTKLDFANATVTVTAKGTRLFKCPKWNFTEQSCNGKWVLFKKGLTPGKNYTFELTPDDPGFGEINVTKAEHLDENKTFISNIYEEVAVRDFVWSEAIYHGEYVKAEFSSLMSNGNVINLYMRNNQSTDTVLEVYHGEDLVGQTGTITQGRYDVRLSGMNGRSKVFYFRVNNLENDTQSFLEFDYIHDSEWILSDTHSDPANQWTNEGNAYDDNTGTYASDNSGGNGVWGAFIYFDFNAGTNITSNKVRVYADYDFGYTDSTDVDVYNVDTSSWEGVHTGAIANNDWEEISFSTRNISRGRFRYHYNSAGAVFWFMEFQFYNLTVPTAPTVSTENATSVEETFGILHGYLDDDGSEACEVRFEYGEDTSYGSYTPWDTYNKTSGERFTYFLKGLEDGKTYHYRAQANNSLGLVNGLDVNFTTGPAPYGWVTSTDHDDPDDEWTWETRVYDDLLDSTSKTKSFHDMSDPDGQWSFPLYFNRTPLKSNRIQFYAKSVAVDRIRISVERNGEWLEIYNAEFADLAWVNQSFKQGLITAANVTFRAADQGSGFFWELYEFDFYKSPNIPPNQTAPILNSTYGTNLTTENLTCYNQSTSDQELDDVKNIYNWYMNGSSLMVLNMPFEGGSNSTWTRDYSPYGNNGIVSGATWNSTGGYDGWGAYEFDGDGDYINPGTDASLNMRSNVTVSAWVKLNEPTDGENNMVYNRENTNPGAVGLNKRASDDRWVFSVRLDGSEGTLREAVSDAVAQTGWHHVAGSYDGDVVKLYIDGNLQSTTDGTNGVIDTDSYTSNNIGRHPTGASYINGTIDELQIYNRSLSPEQILALYQNRTDVMVSNETKPWDVWECSIIPNDGYDDGTENMSNNLTVLPAMDLYPVITSPANDSCVNKAFDWVYVNASIYDIGGSGGTNISVKMLIEGPDDYNETTLINVTGGNHTNVSFVWNITIFTPGVYNITISVNDTNDTNPNNNNVTITVYLTDNNLTAYKEVYNNDTLEYNVSLRLSNIHDYMMCNVYVASYVPPGLNATSFSLMPDGNLTTTGYYAGGKSYYWVLNLTANTDYYINHTMESIDSSPFSVMDSFVLGVDPAR